MKGMFIAFEGVDGSGKTTQSMLLADRLDKKGIAVNRTMEPTDGPIGKLIRKYLSRELQTDEGTLSALFAADRLNHVNSEGGIKDILNNGVWVLTDRYYLSSIAYQSSGLPINWVISVNSFCMSLCKPDMHIFLDVSPDTAIERIRQRCDRTDIYETLEYIYTVRKKYFEAFELLKDKESIAIIDANAPPEIVSERVHTTVSRLFAAMIQ